MMRATTTVLILLFSITLCFGSVKRVKISKTTQADSPVEFSVTITADNQQKGHAQVTLGIPAGQEALTDLWKIYLWVIKDKKTVLVTPLELSYSEDKTIIVRYYGRIDTIGRCLIAIRCGKHAPFSETVYQIDIGSYLKKK